MSNNPRALWDNCLLLIKENVSEQQFNTWFKPIVFESFNESNRTLLLQVSSQFVAEYIEENYAGLLNKVLVRIYGKGIRLNYRVMVDKTNNISQQIQADPVVNIEQTVTRRTRVNQSPTTLDAAQPQQIDSQLNPRHTFANYIEGDSNKLPRAVGLSIAEHPNTTQFNPMFIYGPSGCGKTHLINAIGVRTKEIYPQKRVLYISARLFQVQYTNAVLNNRTNDFINFYQTIDMLIVDDFQECVSAAKTQETFFHIFNHLFRNGKRIILACDRPPVDLQGMSDRLLTRFSCGLIAELEKPNIQLCVDMLNSTINSLLAFSVVYNCKIDMRLAERVIKRAVKIDNEPLTIDDILDTVCNHFNVTTAAVASRSRKRDYVTARQVSMYLAQKYTKMPASRIGKLIGGRDHSTVIHSCTQIEQRIKTDKLFSDEIASIENSFKLKK